jgi:predicted transcriptional regulator
MLGYVTVKRTTIFLDEAAERDLRALAAERDEPVASLVREAIADYLVRRQGEARALSFLAAGRSGRSDVADTHEDLLWTDLEPHGDAGAKGKATRAPRRRAAGKGAAPAKR